MSRAASAPGRHQAGVPWLEAREGGGRPVLRGTPLAVYSSQYCRQPPRGRPIGQDNRGHGQASSPVWAAEQEEVTGPLFGPLRLLPMPFCLPESKASLLPLPTCSAPTVVPPPPPPPPPTHPPPPTPTPHTHTHSPPTNPTHHQRTSVKSQRAARARPSGTAAWHLCLHRACHWKPRSSVRMKLPMPPPRIS